MEVIARGGGRFSVVGNVRILVSIRSNLPALVVAIGRAKKKMAPAVTLETALLLLRLSGVPCSGVGCSGESETCGFVEECVRQIEPARTRASGHVVELHTARCDEAVRGRSECSCGEVGFGAEAVGQVEGVEGGAEGSVPSLRHAKRQVVRQQRRQRRRRHLRNVRGRDVGFSQK